MNLIKTTIKRAAVFMVAASLAVSGTACGGSSGSSSKSASLAKVNKNEKIDIKSFAQKLVSECKYDTKLKSVDDAVSSTMITLSKGSKISMYMGSGKKADTVIVVEAPDSNKAEKDESSVKSYLDDMQKSFQGYLPKEVKKMQDDRVLVRKGNYVAACVTKDSDKARDIIDDSL